MGSDLIWEPKHKEVICLSLDLKLALRKRYENPVNRLMDQYDLEYLCGLQDAGIKDASLLISAIAQYRAIIVKEISS